MFVNSLDFLHLGWAVLLDVHWVDILFGFAVSSVTKACHCLLDATVAKVKFAINHIVVSLYAVHHLSLAAFKFFFFCLFATLMCLDLSLSFIRVNFLAYCLSVENKRALRLSRSYFKIFSCRVAIKCLVASLQLFHTFLRPHSIIHFFSLYLQGIS